MTATAAGTALATAALVWHSPAGARPVLLLDQAGADTRGLHPITSGGQVAPMAGAGWLVALDAPGHGVITGPPGLTLLYAGPLAAPGTWHAAVGERGGCELLVGPLGLGHPGRAPLLLAGAAQAGRVHGGRVPVLIGGTG